MAESPLSAPSTATLSPLERSTPRGRVVCPGFIDIHTHSDLTLVADGTGESKLRQGVTTEVVGNCSFAAFPIEPERLDSARRSSRSGHGPDHPVVDRFRRVCRRVARTRSGDQRRPVGRSRHVACGGDGRRRAAGHRRGTEPDGTRSRPRPRAGCVRDEHRADPRAEFVRRLRRGGCAGAGARRPRSAVCDSLAGDRRPTSGHRWPRRSTSAGRPA